MSKDILTITNQDLLDELRLPRPILKGGSALYAHWDDALNALTPEQRTFLTPEFNPLNHAGNLYHALQIDKKGIENTLLVPGFAILGITDGVHAAGWLHFQHLLNFKIMSREDLYENDEYIKIVESMHPELILNDTFQMTSKGALRYGISVFRQSTNLFLENRNDFFTSTTHEYDTEYLLGLNYMLNCALIHLK